MVFVTVLKLNLEGQVTWQYTGKVLQQADNQVVLEARFNRDDTPFYGIILGKGDRFIESFYTDRWYNIFEMRDRDDDHLKGWYCNIGYPAKISAGTDPSEMIVSYVDLALDLLVYPDGRQVVLDEEEFAALPLPLGVQNLARSALDTLQAEFDKTSGQVKRLKPYLPRSDKMVQDLDQEAQERKN